MKKILFVISVLAAFALGSCSGGEESADQAYAAQKGREDAAKAAKASPGSMDRERALLHIRATEQRLHQLTDSTLARSYKHAAEAYLDSAGVVKTK